MTIEQQPVIAKRGGSLKGAVRVPGDKSISHRALILGAMNVGKTTIRGLLEGDDVLHTARALRLMGVHIYAGNPYVVHGVGVGGLQEPSDVLDLGNSGTGARLLMGLVAAHAFTSTFTGDESLRGRPMRRVRLPLEEMGAQFVSRAQSRLPLSIVGSDTLIPIRYELPVASAQVKSAILLAGLNTAGETTVVEPAPTRDHTERMLEAFGAELTSETREDGARVITLTGQPEFAHKEMHIDVPGDPSSAAFLTVAALIVPGSEVIISNVCMNPHRTGLYTTLQDMGADITFLNRTSQAGEEIADIHVKYSALRGITVPADRAPSMIDEYPILAIAAAFAQGETVMEGLRELRVKESDRLSAIHAGLVANGVQAEMSEDTLVVGGGGIVPGGGKVVTHMDHRIAMSFLVMGLASQHPVTIDDGHMIGTSFPGFSGLMRSLGADIRASGHKPLVIAIDGPAASGKGTLARRLAEYFGLAHLDTGSLYRAVGLKLVNAGQDPSDEDAALAAAGAITPDDLANPRLRNEDVGRAASIVSAMPSVRKVLFDFQQNFAARPQGAVLDGRDIGTVICPDADLKLYVTADLEARARRRHQQLQGQGIEVVYDSVFNDLRERDQRDAARDTAPLKPAADAIHLDTSYMTITEVFDKVVGMVERSEIPRVA